MEKPTLMAVGGGTLWIGDYNRGRLVKIERTWSVPVVFTHYYR